MKRCPETFWELPLTGVLHGRDSKIRGTIVGFAKISAILKRSVNKLFPIENTCQDTKKTATAEERKLKQGATIIDKLKRKYEC